MAYQDRPDIKTQIALNKVAGLTPTLTPAEQQLFAQQQWLESEKQRLAQEKGLPSILGGDVRSYTGSMFAPAGSPMAAVPIPQGAPRVGEAGGGIDVNAYRGSMFGEGVMGAAPVLGGRAPQYNPNVSADVILGRAFGKRPAGQVSYAPTTPAAPQTFTQGQQTPRGSILGVGESVAIGQPIAMAQPTRMAPQAPSAPILGQSYQGVPDMTGGYETMAPSTVSQPSIAAPAPISRPQVQPQPIQPSILGGSVVAMPQQTPAMTPMLGAFQPGSQEYSYLQQRGAAPQALGYAAQAAAASPQQRQFGLQQQQLGFEQQDRAVKRLSADLAAGRIQESSIPPELLGQVRMNATEMGLKNRITQAQLGQLEAKPLPSESYASVAEANDAIKKLGDNLPANTIPTIKREGNRYVIETSIRPPMLTPEEQARAVGLVEKTKSDATFINDIQSNALESSDVMDQNKEVKRLLASGLTTGAGEQFKTNALSVLKSLGINFDSARVGDRQYLISLLGQDALTQAKKFYAKQGSVSDSERKRLDTLALSMDKDPKAVLQIIALRDAAAQRAIDANKYVSSLRESNPNISESELANKAKNWYAENRLSKFLGAAQGAQAGGAGQEIRIDKATGRRYTKDANGNVVVVP